MFLDDIGDTRRGMGAPVSDLILFTRDCVLARMPDASLTVRPGEGHLGGFDAAVEVLGTLLHLWATSKPV